MPPDLQLIVGALLVVTAVVTIACAFILRRRVARAADGLRSAGVALEAQADTLPDAFAAVRAGLAERSAVGEHAAWSLSRVEGQLEGAVDGMRQARAGLDSLRLRLEASLTSADRARWAMRTILRAIELRRAILG